jgi:RimJ/RimL family protein N-acetyltransferase
VKLTITPATPETFDDMAAWRYPPPYELYDGDVEPVLNPERFYAARDEGGGLVGFFYYEDKVGGVLEIGLGLRPDLTGRGLGRDFFQAGLAFAREQLGAERIVLNVAAFNERAIAVYERGGFRRTGSHVRSFERWGDVEFVEMEEGTE